MNNVEVFLESLRHAAPDQVQLIDARAGLLKNDPMQLLRDLRERQVLDKVHLYQLWADSLGVACVIPMTVAMTFALMHILGIELHQVSLAALIVAFNQFLEFFREVGAGMI